MKGLLQQVAKMYGFKILVFDKDSIFFEKNNFISGIWSSPIGMCIFNAKLVSETNRKTSFMYLILT